MLQLLVYTENKKKTYISSPITVNPLEFGLLHKYKQLHYVWSYSSKNILVTT